MDLNQIKDIINNFAKDEKIFTNEQDFQFELASALLNYCDVEEVKLEALSVGENWEAIQKNVEEKKKMPRVQKEYTDLIVREKNGDNFAIELKYKMPYNVCFYETSKEKIVTMVQGAYDHGCYYFIKDIERLEHINSRHFTNGMKIKKSFAILLTNDHNYWDNDFSLSKIWANYSLHEKRKVLPKVLLKFGNETSIKSGRTTFEAIKLNNEHQIKWEEYPLPKNITSESKRNNTKPKFKYLIVEVDG